jgi:hypothetical protein
MSQINYELLEKCTEIKAKTVKQLRKEFESCIEGTPYNKGDAIHPKQDAYVYYETSGLNAVYDVYTGREFKDACGELESIQSCVKELLLPTIDKTADFITWEEIYEPKLEDTVAYKALVELGIYFVDSDCTDIYTCEYYYAS